MIGLTGNIGCGKSTVAKMFATFPDVVVYDADQIWKDIIMTDTCRAYVELLIGPNAFKNGRPQNEVIAAAIFSDREKHVAIQSFAGLQVINEICERKNNHPAALHLVESATMFEGGMQRFFEEFIVVTCPKEEQMRRVLSRKIPGRPCLTRKQVDERMKNQWPQEQKVARANYVIDTHCPLPELERRVKDLYEKLKRASHQGSVMSHQ